MPLPATAAFRIFLLLATLPGTRKQLGRLAKGARDWWSGKKIAVIGPTASGKDSFLARLQNREIPEVHSNTPMGETVTIRSGERVFPLESVYVPSSFILPSSSVPVQGSMKST